MGNRECILFIIFDIKCIIIVILMYGNKVSTFEIHLFEINLLIFFESNSVNYGTCFYFCTFFFQPCIKNHVKTKD